MADLNDRELKSALQQIEKQFGKGAIMQLGGSTHLEWEGISTGALSIDLALGGRGLPRGRIIEIFGPESPARPPSPCTPSPRPRRPAAWRRSSTPEHALDPSWAKKLGVDTESLLVSQHVARRRG